MPPWPCQISPIFGGAAVSDSPATGAASMAARTSAAASGEAPPTLAVIFVMVSMFVLDAKGLKDQS
jgi:hypothetical protein